MDKLRREQFDLDEGRAPWPDTFWRDTPASGNPALLVQVFQQTTLPTTTGVFYACHPVTAMGTEVEGGPATFSVNTGQTLLVLVEGSHAPASGDYLVARFVADRWVAERMGHSGASLCVKIVACGFANVGASVTIQDSHGNVLATGVTDSTGSFCPSGGFAPGAILTVVVSQSGYATSTTSYTMPSTSSMYTVTLSAASVLHLTINGSTFLLHSTLVYPTSYYFVGPIPTCSTSSGNVNVFPIWSCGSLAFSFGTRSCLANGGAEYFNSGNASAAHAGFVSRSNGALLETFTLNSASWPTVHPLFTGTCVVTA
jgi:hypothetical protein